MEKWRTIKDYGDYQISNQGRVISNHYKTPKLLSYDVNSSGYRRVILYNSNGKERYFIHRLVCSHFKDNIKNDMCINHIDGIKENNNIDNLEYISYSENAKHAYRLGLTIHPGGIKGALNKMSKGVKMIDIKNGAVNEYGSIREASRINKLDSSSIAKCCKGKLNLVGGYKWEYA